MKKKKYFHIFIFSLIFSVSLWGQSASDKWSIFGVELGSYNFTDGATVNSRGEIIWKQANRQWEDFGWDLRDVDLSAYEGIKIVLDAESPEIPIDAVKLSNGYSQGHWLFRETFPGVYMVYFDGYGKNNTWGYVGEMDPALGVELFFTVPGTKKNLKTIIKSIEFLEKGSNEKSPELSPFGVTLGTAVLRSFAEKDSIYWRRGFNDSSCGWDFTGLDLSEYDRVRVEVSESDKNLNLILCDGQMKNWHCYGRVSPVVFEVKLTGEGARWVEKINYPFDPAKGLMVLLQKQDDEIRKEETQTIVKSIRFLKPGEEPFDAGEFGIMNRALGCVEDNTVLDGNTIIWKKDNTELKCGWNLVGVDLSEYKGFRVEFEKNEVRLELTITDKDWQNWTAFRGEDPYKIEAYFSKEGAAWKWNDTEAYEKSEGVLLFLRYFSDKPLKKDRKSIIKSIELIK
ncbi:MAG: hypothetical protein MJ181_04520 [Treponema sp.]|nr:hypothetical protein [Treponema sp.]